MSINILMPALSPTMTEGNLVKWHKSEGEIVKSGDLLAEIETDKATMEVEAVDAGILGKIVIPEGTENVSVNSIIAVLLEKGENVNNIKFESSDKESKPACESAVIKDPIKAAQKPIEELQVQPTDIISDAVQSSPSSIDKSDKLNQNRVIASPLAKRLAQQSNIDLTTITGTGPRDRIIKADILDKINDCSDSKDFSKTIYNQAEFKSVKLTSIRKVIAKRLTESKQFIPHFYLTEDVKVDALLKAREEINSTLDKAQKISVNDFIIKAMAHALHEIPEANAGWGEDHIKLYNRIDIAVAIAIEGGLITPIIFDAYNKSLSYISDEMKSLIARARDNKLKPHEYQGGTISLSNLGMYDIKNFTAIVNPPQACILAVGRAMPQPIVENNQLKIGTLMSCTLSVDHRVIDGAVGARYIKALQRYIESPVKLFYS